MMSILPVNEELLFNLQHYEVRRQKELGRVRGACVKSIYNENSDEHPCKFINILI